MRDPRIADSLFSWLKVTLCNARVSGERVPEIRRACTGSISLSIYNGQRLCKVSVNVKLGYARY